MTPLALPLPEELRTFAEARAKEMNCASATEYIVSLLQDEWASSQNPSFEPSRLRRLIAEGDASEANEVTPEYLDGLIRHTDAVIAAAAKRGARTGT
ncbi:MAG TPA: hypothetical protein VF595_04960 [Tepidisphaeraceae bacterium]|jgi:hypothetical protein